MKAVVTNNELLTRSIALYDKLRRAVGLEGGPMTQGDLDIQAIAAMDLLTMVLANMPEPMRSERINLYSTTMAANVANKRLRLEKNQKEIPNRFSQ